MAHVKLYDRKNALVAADLLNERVVPFYDKYEIPLMRILTDRGTEYCGNREHHEYQLYLAIEDIDHSKTKAKSSQTNGICERFHRTMQEEFFWTAFRKKIYTTVSELQNDLDAWLKHYNTQRPHSGKYCYGKTPIQTLVDSIDLAKKKLIDSQKLIFGNDLEKSSVTTSSEKVVEEDFSSSSLIENFNNFEQNLNDSN